MTSNPGITIWMFRFRLKASAGSKSSKVPDRRLYGSDAVGGVVNFITRAPERSEMRLRTAFGSFGTNQQQGELAYAANRWSRATQLRPRLLDRLHSKSRLSKLVAGVADLAGHVARNQRNHSCQQTTGLSAPSSSTGTTTHGSARAPGSPPAGNRSGEKTDVAFAFRRHTDLFVLYRDRPLIFTNRHAVEGYQASVRRREDLGQNVKLYLRSGVVPRWHRQQQSGRA